MKRIVDCTTAEEVAAVRKRSRDYYQRNRERMLAQSKAAQKRRNAEFPELIRARNAPHVLSGEAAAAASMRYYYANRDKILARKKQQSALARAAERDT